KEREIQNWLASILEKEGFTTRLFEPNNSNLSKYPDYNPNHNYDGRPNLVATLKGSGAGKSLILNGHVDTVPIGELSKWTYGPWDGEIKNGKMYGRGTADMKGGLAATILSAIYLKRIGLELEGDLIIQSVVDEEGGGNGALSCVDEGYTADAAIVAEPTNLEIQPIGRGVLLLQIDIIGKSSHAAFKWDGVNAIEKALKINRGLEDLEHNWLANKNNPLFPSPTINLGVIEGGTEAPIVPNHCTVKYDIKYLPIEVDTDGNEVKKNGEQIKKEVENHIYNICESDEWLKDNPPSLNWYLHVMPHNTNSSHELVSIAKSSTEELFGTSKVSGLRSGSDARHLLNTGKVPTIVFGPGSMREAHTIDENISLDDYINGIKA